VSGLKLISQTETVGFSADVQYFPTSIAGFGTGAFVTFKNILRFTKR